jgi:hypothetical protein
MKHNAHCITALQHNYAVQLRRLMNKEFPVTVWQFYAERIERRLVLESEGDGDEC